MEQKNYINYDYLTLKTNNSDASAIINRYQSLGWKLDRQNEGLVGIALTFKRDRNIKNKDQLNMLQLRIEDCANGIENLMKDRKSSATIFALTFGSIVTLIFGGGLSLLMFSFDPVNIKNVVVGLALGLVGAMLASLTYPFYKRIVHRKTIKTNPIIEKRSDELADLCQEAHGITVAI